MRESMRLRWRVCALAFEKHFIVTCALARYAVIRSDLFPGLGKQAMFSLLGMRKGVENGQAYVEKRGTACRPASHVGAKTLAGLRSICRFVPIASMDTFHDAL